MSAINTGKVIVGGLVAGVVFNIVDMINGMYIMAEDFRAHMTRLGLDPTAMETGGMMATWVVIDFLFGFLVVFTYAAIRPRFGPGPKTAVYAGLIPYLAVTMVMFIESQMGMSTMNMFAKMSIIQLVSTVIGSIAGASVYKE